MSKPPKRTALNLQIEAVAKRRGGATYIEACMASKARLIRLRDEYAATPAAYRGYLAVGICSCLESHLKYSYAYAAERYGDYPELLKTLFKEINVDIDTLISTSAKTFHLADVVAANIKASSLETYKTQASHFFTVLQEKPVNFPWDIAKYLITVGDPELSKEFAEGLSRLERIFEARHNFVHETAISDEPVEGIIEGVDDAIQLITLFEKGVEGLDMSQKYAIIRADEGLNTATERLTADIDLAFEVIRAECKPRQYERLDALKAAFMAYLYARTDFQASVFIAFQSEASMSYYLDLVPQYLSTLSELALKQKHLLAQYPDEEQMKNMGIDLADDPALDKPYPDKAGGD